MLRVAMMFAAMTFAGAAAHAADAAAAAPVDFNAKLKGFDGEVLHYCAKSDDKTQRCADIRDWTLKDLAVLALSVQEQNESGIDQVGRGVLAEDIYKNGTVALDAKETNSLCEAIAKYVNKTSQSAVLTLDAWRILDPNRVTKAK